MLKTGKHAEILAIDEKDQRVSEKGRTGRMPTSAFQLDKGRERSEEDAPLSLSALIDVPSYRLYQQLMTKAHPLKTQCQQ
jgi:hypothetical protein